METSFPRIVVSRQNALLAVHRLQFFLPRRPTGAGLIVDGFANLSMEAR